MKWLKLAVSLLCLCTNSAFAGYGAGNPNYAEALQKSLFFYEAQRSGPLPADHRVSWRGPSALEDGRDYGVDLRGGWYDAGDHVKFGFPAAAAATLLAWSLLENPDGYTAFGQEDVALANLRWINDYFIKAHSAPDELWVQVGGGNEDHAYWGPAETMPMARPAYKITAECPGSDVAAETAAAMAAASLVFSTRDPKYSRRLAEHAKTLYSFADKYRGIYSLCVRDAEAYYQSTGYDDELMWGALWLYRLTRDTNYLSKAKAIFDTFQHQNQHPFRWTHAWDDKLYGSYVLLTRYSDDPRYREATERWLDFWTVGVAGERVTYTPGGLAWLNAWGVLRYTANTALLAIYYAKDLDQRGDKHRADRYYHFGKRQIDYILGHNPESRSYVVGFGQNSPMNPHHRGAHGSWANNIERPVTNRHILYGALVGGPDIDDRYVDERREFVKNEVAVDYNAGFTGALAALVERYGGAVEVGFPKTEIRDDEFFVTAKASAEGQDFFEVALRVHNHTAWPARATRNIRARYFFDLSELDDHSRVFRNIRVVSSYNQGVLVSSVQPFKQKRGIYFIEFDFSESGLAPIGDIASQKEVQARMILPRSMDLWRSDNDWSYRDLGQQDFIITESVTVYENGRLVWGREPGD